MRCERAPPKTLNVAAHNIDLTHDRHSLDDKPRPHRLMDDWSARPRVSASLPVRLPGGGVLETITGTCSGCGQGIPDEDLHGTVACVVPAVATVSAIGYCRACRCVTPVNHRLRAVTGEVQLEWINKEGRWVKRRLEREENNGRGLGAFVRRIIDGLKRLVAQ